MAAIDYGVLVFKDGVLINENKFYMDMKESVGWIDTPYCKNDFFAMPHRVNGNYFAYIGNKEFTIAIFKNRAAIYINKNFVDEIWENQDKNGKNHMSFYYIYNNISIHIKQIIPQVYLLSTVINNSHYNIIYGYGIDSDMTIWNKIKVRYLGKRNAKKIDNLINKFWTKRNKRRL